MEKVLCAFPADGHGGPRAHDGPCDSLHAVVHPTISGYKPMMSPEELAARYGTPLYIYDLDLVRQRARELREAIDYRPLQLLYAIKANPCPALVQALIAEDYGIDAVSPGEIALARRIGVEPAAILYTENNATDAELAEASAAGVLVNCGSLDRLQRLGRSGGKSACVRINPDVGAAEHAHTLTAGPLTKFGIHHSQVDEILRIEHETGIEVTGCHMHIGSNILDADVFVAAMRVILDVARRLPHLQFIDFGGGLGVPYRPDDQPIDLMTLGKQAGELMRAFCADYGRELQMRLEPGRYLAAEAGTLYTMVTSVKTRPAYDGEAERCFIGCDTGFNHLLRPCLYGSYHPIGNVTRPMAETRRVDVVGNVCESGDIFARDREIPEPRTGDILAIGCAGAYGMSMASTYNLRPLPAELVVEDGDVRMVRERRSIDDLLDDWLWPPAIDGSEAEAS